MIDNHLSEWLPGSSGVPQVSILGPLLFILYINDLPSTPSFSHLYLFADDTKCCSRVLSLSDSSRLQKDLDLICNWSSRCSLDFNVSKCCLIRFYKRSKSHINSTYHLNGSEIPAVDHCRDLGVVFSSNLSWSLHYDSISAKAYRQLGLIRRTFSSSLPIRVKKLLYLSLVRSQITYCSQLWRPYLIKDIVFLEKIKR